MSALPSAVKKQIADANQIAEQLQSELRAHANQGQNPPQEGQVPPDQGAPVAHAAPPQDPPQGEVPANPPTPASDGWEQKYKVLQGKYNAEVPRLQRTVNEQSGRMEQMTQQLVSLQAMIAAMQQRQAAPAVAPQPLVKPEEIKEFGPDLHDFIRRTAQEVVQPTLEQSLRPVREQVKAAADAAESAAQAEARNKRAEVFALLNKEVPDWQSQDKDPGFLEWLDETDPYSGQQRGYLLKAAMSQNDAPRVVLFFKTYRNENAALNPQVPAPPKAEAPVKLEQMVAPGTPRAAGAGAQDVGGKRIWTTKEINAFYRDCADGKFIKNKPRRDEIEREIFSAQAEGRIR